MNVTNDMRINGNGQAKTAASQAKANDWPAGFKTRLAGFNGIAALTEADVAFLKNQPGLSDIARRHMSDIYGDKFSKISEADKKIVYYSFWVGHFLSCGADLQRAEELARLSYFSGIGNLIKAQKLSDLSFEEACQALAKPDLTLAQPIFPNPTGRSINSVQNLNNSGSPVNKAPQAEFDLAESWVKQLQPADVKPISREQILAADWFQPPAGLSREKFYAGLKALMRHESAGIANIANQRTACFGLFQITPSYLSSWAAAAGLPADSLPTYENQWRVASHQAKTYYEKYGTWDNVFAAWYGGPGAVARKRKTGSYDNNRTANLPMNEPSIQNYVLAMQNRLADNMENVG